MKRREKNKAIYNFVMNQEMISGSSFLIATPEDNPYIFISTINEMVYMPKAGRGADVLFAYLNLRYGLSEREDMTKFVYDTMRHHAAQLNNRQELRRFAAYKKASNVLYISGRDGTMWRLDGSSIHQTRNGEGCFFIDDDGGVPCHDVDIGDHGLLLDKLTNLNFTAETPSGITPDQQRKALIVWMFMIAFPDLMPTKPLLILEGAPGSGKSTAAMLFQHVLLGAKKPMLLDKDQNGDFGTMLLRSPIAVFDNIDNYISWIPDAVCGYATSGIWVKRKLYTDNEEVILRPHAFIVIASKNPASFRREDTADRCIIIRLDRWLSFTPLNELEKELTQLRGKLLGEYLWYLNKIVAELGNSGAGGQSHRMADFANMAHVVGRVLGWAESDVEGLLSAIQSERDVFISEDDSLAELLTMWLKYKPRGGAWNIGRIVTVQELFGELEAFAAANKIPFYKNAKMLAQKIRSPHLDKQFIIQSVVVSGHNAKSYQIWPQPNTDSPLTVLPGGKDKDTLPPPSVTLPAAVLEVVKEDGGA